MMIAAVRHFQMSVFSMSLESGYNTYREVCFVHHKCGAYVSIKKDPKESRGSAVLGQTFQLSNDVV